MPEDSEYLFEDLTCEPYDIVDGTEDNDTSKAHKDISIFLTLVLKKIMRKMYQII